LIADGKKIVVPQCPKERRTPTLSKEFKIPSRLAVDVHVYKN